jgi:hypothetical protein
MTRTLETTAIVTADHTITLKPPDEVPEGRCQVVVTLKNCQSEGKASLALNLIPGPWPEGFTASREQIYDDDGR